MKAFAELTEQEILALAISAEEEDARIYADYAEGLKGDFPASAKVFTDMAAEENEHRRMLIELHRAKFGEHIPLVRRHDVSGFARHEPLWIVRPLGLDRVRKQAEAMEFEARRFYERALAAPPTPACASCWATSPRRSAPTSAWRSDSAPSTSPTTPSRPRRRRAGACSCCRSCSRASPD